MSSTVERFAKKSTKTVQIKDPDEPNEPPYDFVIQRLSTFDLIESEEMSETIGDDTADIMSVDEKKVTLQQIKGGVFPLMKRFIPICTINPKIIFEGEVPEGSKDCLHQRQIPMQILSELFNEILRFSGLDKESVDKIKKKQQVQSPKI